MRSTVTNNMTYQNHFQPQTATHYSPHPQSGLSLNNNGGPHHPGVSAQPTQQTIIHEGQLPYRLPPPAASSTHFNQQHHPILFQQGPPHFLPPSSSAQQHPPLHRQLRKVNSRFSDSDVQDDLSLINTQGQYFIQSPTTMFDHYPTFVDTMEYHSPPPGNIGHWNQGYIGAMDQSSPCGQRLICRGGGTYNDKQETI